MSRDITMCHPRLQILAKKLITECEKMGLKIGISECFRTVEEQDALYAQGRTKAGNIVTNAKGSDYSSQHQWGIAFDFYRNDGKGAYNTDENFFIDVGCIAKKIGLAWGGDWKSFSDMPHLYLPDWGSTTIKLKRTYKNVGEFKRTWGALDPVIRDTVPISLSNDKLEVTASSLVIRKTPNGEDTGKRYVHEEKIDVFEKCFCNDDPWFHTKDGWVSGKHLTGWIYQDNKWWYLTSGYNYLTGLNFIKGKHYVFDFDGWMITSDRISKDGHILPL